MIKKDDLKYEHPESDPTKLSSNPLWHLKDKTKVNHPERASGRLVFGLNTDRVHADGVTGKGVLIAIIDSGADCKHPCLGWDAGTESNPVIASASTNLEFHRLDGSVFNQSGNIRNPLDAHGTALAGIVAGRGSNVTPPTSASAEARDLQAKYLGVAPDASVLVIRLFTNFQADQFKKALEIVKDADVLLLSRTFPQVDEVMRAENNRAGTDPLAEERARGYREVKALLAGMAKSMPIVCAAGNGGFNGLSFPASLPDTIAVGAVNELGWRSTYSQFGKGLDVVAPSSDAQLISKEAHRVRVCASDKEAEKRLKKSGGVDRNSERLGYFGIVSTDNTGDDGYMDEESGFGDFTPLVGPRRFGGTSAAAAQVAGVVALMLEANPHLKGEPHKIREILRDSASMSNLSSETEENVVKGSLEFGHGRVDASAAVTAAKQWKKPAPGAA